MSLLLRRWRLLLQRRLGLYGIAAFVLAVSGAGLWTWSIQVERQAQALLKTRQQRSARPVELPAPAVQEPWQQMTAKLPHLDSNAADLKRVFALARSRQINLKKGDYQFIREPRVPFVTLVALFPVKDTYGNVKAFAADVLHELPHASLQELSFDRSDASSTQVEARMRLNFIYQDD